MARLCGWLMAVVLAAVCGCGANVRYVTIDTKRHLRCELSASDAGKPLYFEACKTRSDLTWRVVETRVPFECEEAADHWLCVANYTITSATGEAIVSSYRLHAKKP